MGFNPYGGGGPPHSMGLNPAYNPQYMQQQLPNYMGQQFGGQAPQDPTPPPSSGRPRPAPLSVALAKLRQAGGADPTASHYDAYSMQQDQMYGGQKRPSEGSTRPDDPSKRSRYGAAAVDSQQQTGLAPPPSQLHKGPTAMPPEEENFSRKYKESWSGLLDSKWRETVAALDKNLEVG